MSVPTLTESEFLLVQIFTQTLRGFDTALGYNGYRYY